MIEPSNPDRWIDVHSPLVYRTCRRNTSSEDSAWEAFQETFLAYMRRRDELDLKSEHAPWLYETARRCCLAVVRKERRLPVTGLSDIEAVTPPINDGQADTAFLAEAAAVLRDEIRRLSDEDQELLRCVYADGMTHREVAGQLNCPPGSIHARAEQARKRLRKRMERRGIVVGALLALFLLQCNAKAAQKPVASLVQTTKRPRKLGWQALTTVLLTLVAGTIYAELHLNEPGDAGSAVTSREVDSRAATGCGSHESTDVGGDNPTDSQPAF